MKKSFEFTDEELIDILSKHLSKENYIQNGKWKVNLEAFSTNPWSGKKGFNVRINLEEVKDD